ncbi:uncharacterized protein BJ171DRAFT_477444 [Polychytrium aggregatum]|uniref:uncharacterized protein n=1 Tax=Polychytrium aggregatum TaxID=110093 RepID=UPI0022FF0A9D|nr:uncharacterized protein BJ171DRAFT_477444 [Polychytrium aggregatum]KAI9199558.1 hypothetical protein BJ171DRAFT_477444 [Polychytrium aggregatum]
MKFISALSALAFLAALPAQLSDATPVKRTSTLAVQYNLFGWGRNGDTFRIPATATSGGPSQDPRYLWFSVSTNFADTDAATGQPNTFAISLLRTSQDGLGNPQIQVFPTTQTNANLRANYVGYYFAYGSIPGLYVIQVKGPYVNGVSNPSTFSVANSTALHAALYRPQCESPNFSIPTDDFGNPIKTTRGQVLCNYNTNLADIQSTANYNEIVGLLSSCLSDATPAGWIATDATTSSWSGTSSYYVQVNRATSTGQTLTATSASATYAAVCVRGS